MTDFGRDISCTDSLRSGKYVSGLRLVGEAVYRRLTTRTGELMSDPDYGLHLGDYLGASVSPDTLAKLPGLIKSQVTRDARVVSAEVDINETTSGPDTSWAVSIRVSTDLGPFDLVIGVSEANATLLEIST